MIETRGKYLFYLLIPCLLSANPEGGSAQRKSTSGKPAQTLAHAKKPPVKTPSKSRSKSTRPVRKPVAGSSASRKSTVKKKTTVTRSGSKSRGRSTARAVQNRSGRKSSLTAAGTNRTRAAQASARRNPSASVRLKQEELDRIRAEIREYEQRLAQTRKQERSTLNRLDDFDRQTSLIRTLLSQLHRQVEEHQQGIAAAETQLVRTSLDLDELQQRYARSIVNAYKRGRAHDTELLLAAASLNQMYLRARYLRAFTEDQRSRADDIRAKKSALETQKTELVKRIGLHRRTIGEKKTEETALERKLAEQQSLLEKVRQDKSSYNAQLKKKQAAAAKIERLIADLVDRERARRTASGKTRGGTTAASGKGGKRTSVSAELPSAPISETPFGRLRGRLPWPVARGSIVGDFGEQVNPRIGTVTLSNGIDIGVADGSSVRAVADGEVSMVYFIPGYGNLLILNHGDGFFTVYAHLSDILVRDGNKVKAGQTIARSGQGISGPQLHFEVWRGREKQNPLGWLAK